MDRKSIIGLVLIFAVLMIFSYINQPSKQEIEAAKHRQDSISRVRAEQEKRAEAEKSLLQEAQTTALNLENIDSVTSDVASELSNLYGDFGVAAVGSEEFITIENNLIKVVVSSKGGRIYSVELKNYKRHDGKELILFEGEKSMQNIEFFAQNRNIKTDQFFFKPSVDKSSLVVNGPKVPKGSEGRLKFNQKHPGENTELVMRLDLGNDRYLEYVYSISYNSYQVGFDIRLNGLEKVISTSTGYLNFNFAYDVPRQEKTSKYGEDSYTTMYYKYKDDDVDNLKRSKSDSEDLNTSVKWIGFKQLFFSTVIIANDAFPNASIASEIYKDDKNYLAHFKTGIGLPFDSKTKHEYKLSYYFGPNHYQTLKEQGFDMEKLISLGWPVVREVNRFIIIPVFNFLNKHINSFGIIILLLTILIRIIVFPFTYKSYVSQAKMRVLKPEIDEITKKIPADKAMERQQATMALYKKAGVNPMGGCLPMLFQMPILIAMFYFFPGSIELRQEAFLWASDLSTYDSILNLPFTIPMYGNHVSLFTLLMTITTLIQTHLQSQTQDTSAMPGMKYMLYFMPVFFMFILNSYSSGLSYYYFLANVFTIGQTYIIRRMINEDKVRLQIQSNQKKPVTKSGFQRRLEEMAKQQQGMRKK